MKTNWKKLLCVLFFAGAFFMVFPAGAKAAEKGWVTEGNVRYYYKNGEKVRGLKKIGKQKYYFKKSNGEMVKSRWVRINHKLYFFMKNGQMAKKRWISNKYYVGRDGVRVTNQWIGNRFVGENGRWIPGFHGGWQKIDGKWYYYTADGTKKTGWLTYRKQRYYLDKNGVRVTKFTTINKKNYAFTKKGVLRTNTWVKKGGLYYRTNAKGVVDMREGFDVKDPTSATHIKYHTSTITVDIQKHYQYHTNYWIAKVKISHPEQLRSALSYGTYGGTRETTSSAVARNNGIIGINGSAFSYESGKPGFDAVMIKDGKIYNKALGTSYSVMAVTYDGVMYTPDQGLSARDLVRQGVKDTYNFGPPIIKNGITQPIIDPFQDTVSFKDPRSAVGMVRPGEYVLLVADGRGAGGSQGLNYYEMAKIFESYHCIYAYNMDGGGSATLAYRGRVLNRPSDGSERPCGDFLYFKE